MNANKKKKVILILLILLAGAVVVMGGYYFYASTLEDAGALACLGMALHNAAETLLFNPILPMSDLYADTEFINGLDMLGKGIVVSYSIAVILTPLLDVLIIFSILEEMFKFFVGFGFFEKRILIIGYNPKVKSIIDAGFSNSRVYLWSESELPAEEEMELYRKRVTVYVADSYIGESNKKDVGELKNFERLMMRKKITHVLLLNESDARNMHYYIALSNNEACKKRTVHFCVHNNNYEVRTALENYYNVQVDEVKKNGDITAACPDMEMFSKESVEARLLFSNMPFFAPDRKDEPQAKDVHLLIVGGGALGEAILFHAMNQAVCSPENRILIDVVDIEISSLRRVLMSRFCGEYVKYDAEEDAFTLGGGDADGELCIRLRQCDVYEDDFLNYVRERDAESPYTYIAVTLRDGESNLHCALEFDKVFSGKNRKFPVAYRIPYSKYISEYMESFDYCLETYLTGYAEEYVGTDDIVDLEEERAVRIYNSNYEDLVNGFMGWQDADKNIVEKRWNKLKYFQRQGSRALYYHRGIKELMFVGETEEAARLKEAFGNAASVTDEMWSEELVGKAGETDKYPALLEWARTEHRRWCYFYASEGWGWGEEKAPEMKRHPCLCGWEKLKERPDTRRTIIYDLISSPVFMNAEK